MKHVLKSIVQVLSEIPTEKFNDKIALLQFLNNYANGADITNYHCYGKDSVPISKFLSLCGFTESDMELVNSKFDSDYHTFTWKTNKIEELAKRLSKIVSESCYDDPFGAIHANTVCLRSITVSDFFSSDEDESEESTEDTVEHILPSFHSLTAFDKCYTGIMDIPSASVVTGSSELNSLILGFPSQSDYTITPIRYITKYDKIPLTTLSRSRTSDISYGTRVGINSEDEEGDPNGVFHKYFTYFVPKDFDCSKYDGVLIMSAFPIKRNDLSVIEKCKNVRYIDSLVESMYKTYFEKIGVASPNVVILSSRVDVHWATKDTMYEAVILASDLPLKHLVERSSDEMKNVPSLKISESVDGKKDDDVYITKADFPAEWLFCVQDRTLKHNTIPSTAVEEFRKTVSSIKPKNLLQEPSGFGGRLGAVVNSIATSLMSRIDRNSRAYDIVNSGLISARHPTRCTKSGYVITGVYSGITTSGSSLATSIAEYDSDTYFPVLSGVSTFTALPARDTNNPWPAAISKFRSSLLASPDIQLRMAPRNSSADEDFDPRIYTIVFDTNIDAELVRSLDNSTNEKFSAFVIRDIANIINYAYGSGSNTCVEEDLENFVRTIDCPRGKYFSSVLGDIAKGLPNDDNLYENIRREYLVDIKTSNNWSSYDTRETSHFVRVGFSVDLDGRLQIICTISSDTASLMRFGYRVRNGLPIMTEHMWKKYGKDINTEKCTASIIGNEFVVRESGIRNSLNCSAMLQTISERVTSEEYARTYDPIKLATWVPHSIQPLKSSIIHILAQPAIYDTDDIREKIIEAGLTSLEQAFA